MKLYKEDFEAFKQSQEAALKVFTVNVLTTELILKWVNEMISKSKPYPRPKNAIPKKRK